MSAERHPLVVLGMGNILLRDDGVGVRVVEALGLLASRDHGTLPEDTRLVDGGTLGIDLLRSVAGARGLLLVDGVDLGRRPGSLVVLRGDEILAEAGVGRAPHAGAAGLAGVAELLGTARLMGWLPDAVALLGIQVCEVGFDVALTPAVEAAIPVAVEAARRELRAMDVATAMTATTAPDDGRTPAGSAAGPLAGARA